MVTDTLQEAVARYFSRSEVGAGRPAVAGDLVDSAGAVEVLGEEERARVGDANANKGVSQQA